MRIIGLDPGSYACGVGIVETVGGCLIPIAYEVLRPPRSGRPEERLTLIHDGICGVIERFVPHVCAMEKVFSAFNPATALRLGEARGAALLAMGRHGLVVHSYSATQVKKAVVGYGRAEKAQTQQMIFRTLNLPELPPADAADALALAVCHAVSAVPVEARQRAMARTARVRPALAKVVA